MHPIRTFVIAIWESWDDLKFFKMLPTIIETYHQTLSISELVILLFKFCPVEFSAYTEFTDIIMKFSNRHKVLRSRTITLYLKLNSSFVEYFRNKYMYIWRFWFFYLHYISRLSHEIEPFHEVLNGVDGVLMQFLVTCSVKTKTFPPHVLWVINLKPL